MIVTPPLTRPRQIVRRGAHIEHVDALRGLVGERDDCARHYSFVQAVGSRPHEQPLQRRRWQCVCARRAGSAVPGGAPHVARRGIFTSETPFSRGVNGVDMLRRRELAKITARPRGAAAPNGGVCCRRAAAGPARISSDRSTTVQMCVARCRRAAAGPARIPR